MKNSNLKNINIQLVKQQGLSLVELMISLTIGLILLLGITTLIVQQSSTRNEMDKASRQIENGRYAMQLLSNDIQHAGYYGEYFEQPTPPIGALPDPCTITPATAVAAAIPLPVQGYNAPAAIPTCINSANHLAGTDILVIRRAQTAILSSAPVSNEVYLQTGTKNLVATAEIQYGNPAGFALGSLNADNTVAIVGTTANGVTATVLKTANNASATPKNYEPRIAANIRKYIVQIYFISPCSVMANNSTCTASDDGGKPIPTLKMLELGVAGGATTFNLIPLVEGIEQMQLEYGLDNIDTTVTPNTVDGYPDQYVTDPGVAAGANPGGNVGWSNVMAIRANLLARNTECTTGYTDNKNYNLGLGNTSVTPPASDCNNGGYKRHAFTELVRLINPSGRRAQQ